MSYRSQNKAMHRQRLVETLASVRYQRAQELDALRKYAGGDETLGSPAPCRFRGIQISRATISVLLANQKVDGDGE